MRFVVGSLGFALVGACFAISIGGCSNAPAATDDAQSDDARSGYVIPSSTASTSELGVVGWRVDFAGDAYRVTGMDADENEQVVMRLWHSTDASGVTSTNIGLKTPAGQFLKTFTAADDPAAAYQDGIAADPRAARALALMGLDVGQSSTASTASTDITKSSIHPLSPTLTEPPSGKGLAFGNDSGKKGCGDDGNLVRPSCTNIIKQTNLDCMTTAQCQQRSACGGSDSQCRKDQAYVRTLGCDIKCAPAPGRTT